MSNLNYKIKPNLIIGGVFKVGTTSLFSYLSVHEQIATSSKKELGFFVPLQFNQSIGPINEYLKYFSHIKNSTYVLEASPGYLYGGHKIATTMKSVLGDFKIIFILREPMTRLISFYKYLKTSYIFAYGETISESQKIFIEEMTFNSYVNNSLNCLINNEINDANEAYLLSGVSYSLYSRYLNEWFNTIDSKNIKVIFFDSLKNDPHGLMCEICEWLDISSAVYNDYSFIIENKTRDVKNKFFHTIASKINRNFETFFRSNPSIKKKVRNIYYRFNQKQDTDENFHLNDELINYFNTEKRDLNLLLKKHGYKNTQPWAD